jgi:hypothetical protein
LLGGHAQNGAAGEFGNGEMGLKPGNGLALASISAVPNNTFPLRSVAAAADVNERKK